MGSKANTRNGSIVYMKCPSCGKSAERRLGSAMIFCQYCGSRLTDSEKIVKSIIDHDNSMSMKQFEHDLKKDEMTFAHNLKAQRPNINMKDELVKSGKLSGTDFFERLINIILRTILLIVALSGIGFAIIAVIKIIGKLISAM